MSNTGRWVKVYCAQNGTVTIGTCGDCGFRWVDMATKNKYCPACGKKKKEIEVEVIEEDEP